MGQNIFLDGKVWITWKLCGLTGKLHKIISSRPGFAVQSKPMEGDAHLLLEFINYNQLNQCIALTNINTEDKLK